MVGNAIEVVWEMQGQGGRILGEDSVEFMSEAFRDGVAIRVY
jgi:hypothetical protein